MKSQTRGFLARWYLRIFGFLPNIRIEYKPGSTNCVADALSRARVHTQENSDVLRVTEQLDDPLMRQVQAQQRQDPSIKEYLENRVLPKDPLEIKRVVTLANKGYFLISGVLYYENPDVPGRKRLVVPKHLQGALLDEYHDVPFAGHFGNQETFWKVSTVLLLGWY